VVGCQNERNTLESKLSNLNDWTYDIEEYDMNIDTLSVSTSMPDPEFEVRLASNTNRYCKAVILDFYPRSYADYIIKHSLQYTMLRSTFPILLSVYQSERYVVICHNLPDENTINGCNYDEVRQFLNTELEQQSNLKIEF
jgi:hypothetical protein